jgi:hypothetical protein
MRGKFAKKVRQEGALERLKNSKFFEKGDRTEESWLKVKEREIENLEIALGIRAPRKA